ncbi:MAG: class I SAM-dependent methyltransferase [Candidatus Heimdallarchaeota archaeon]|nr:MAG: class I SAM-dependent methyltransferase [Candidatus Heimdallarchaeota archaeon]
MSNEENRLSWNRLSEYYQSSTYISLDDIHYGPYSPGEKELNIIGDVTGLDCLELGCGGGQISIVLAKWGANKVIGLDISDKQLEFAQSLAKKADVDVTFIRRNMENLSLFEESSFDLVISVHAISYVENILNVISETFRVLRTSGRFVFCTLHPIQFVLWEALEENTFEKIYPYFTSTRDSWDWINDKKQKIATFGQTYRRFEEWINGLITNDFEIERVIEPRAYTMKQLQEMDLNTVPYHDKKEINEKFVRVSQIIPFSLIISAKKE